MAPARHRHLLVEELGEGHGLPPMPAQFARATYVLLHKLNTSSLDLSHTSALPRLVVLAVGQDKLLEPLFILRCVGVATI
eukprot:1837402-Alexandrium_andersonii.AAC.1